jgi:hypothetical protein
MGHVRLQSPQTQVHVCRANPDAHWHIARRIPLVAGIFRDTMRDLGVFSHKRYSGGDDVGAACGQLAGAAADQSQTQVTWQCVYHWYTIIIKQSYFTRYCALLVPGEGYVC